MIWVESSEGETVIHNGNRPELQVATTPCALVTDNQLAASAPLFSSR
jgi:hypothetical protein